MQPSGLTIRNDTLLTISDKDDSTIFWIELGEKEAFLHPFLRFRLPESISIPADFEGITLDEEGTIYLISESLFRILKVRTDGSPAEWITPSLKPWGQREGLFRKRNANLEGITWIGGNQFILCQEREPRGMLTVRIESDAVRVKAFQLDESIFPFPKGRKPDFAGLYWFQQNLYVLERNPSIVARLVEADSGFVEKNGWSYGHVESRDSLRYTDIRYGLAEGLAMDKNFVYIVLDNNGDARYIDPDNRRAQLFVFHWSGN
ncbi:MAG: hypothetical protein Kow0042_18080 [Calditrichia bacterium]